MDLTEEEYNDYIEVFRHMNTWDGKLYTIPFNKSNWVMYYNKELIPEPPKTLDEFFQIAKEVSEKTGGETRGFGIRPTLELFHAFLWLNGGDFFDEDLNVTFDGPEGKLALQQMIAMLEDGSALQIDGYEDGAFGDRMIAMYIGSSRALPTRRIRWAASLSSAPLPARWRKAGAPSWAPTSPCSPPPAKRSGRLQPSSSSGSPTPRTPSTSPSRPVTSR